MKRFWLCGLTLALAACAAPVPNAPAVAPQDAMARVAPGAAKADVAAALGPAMQIDFDNGHAVWAYRWPDAAEPRDTRAATELVILFDRAGRVQKLRLRPGYRQGPTVNPESSAPPAGSATAAILASRGSTSPPGSSPGCLPAPP